jgi:ketosteroid isomerase-like protein
MKRWTGILFLGLLATTAHAVAAADIAQIEAFNAALSDATRRMDKAATLKLWDDAGISLLPSTRAIVGKRAIARFLDDVMAQVRDGRMEAFDMQCFDVEVSGDWASEWCREHQVVDFANGKPRFEGWGKMLLVLHRKPGGEWRLAREMWNEDVDR